jgi:hypothetical protein
MARTNLMAQVAKNQEILKMIKGPPDLRLVSLTIPEVSSYTRRPDAPVIQYTRIKKMQLAENLSINVASCRQQAWSSFILTWLTTICLCTQGITVGSSFVIEYEGKRFSVPVQPGMVPGKPLQLTVDMNA